MGQGGGRGGVRRGGQVVGWWGLWGEAGGGGVGRGPGGEANGDERGWWRVSGDDASACVNVCFCVGGQGGVGGERGKRGGRGPVDVQTI